MKILSLVRLVYELPVMDSTVFIILEIICC